MRPLLRLHVEEEFDPPDYPGATCLPVLPHSVAQGSQIAMAPLLEITIPTFNRPDQLRENLPNLCAQVADLEPGLVEIRVIDDASTDTI